MRIFHRAWRRVPSRRLGRARQEDSLQHGLERNQPATLPEGESPWYHDPEIGLPVSRTMNTPGFVPPTFAEFLALIESCNEEEAMSRAGLSADTNIWVALQFKRHPHHQVAVGFLETRAEETPVFIARIVEQSFLRLISPAAICRNPFHFAQGLDGRLSRRLRHPRRNPFRHSRFRLPPLPGVRNFAAASHGMIFQVKTAVVTRPHAP